MAEMLELEVDTMGEDWLVTLQDEFRKSYFTTVGCRTDYQETRLTAWPAEAVCD